MEPVIHRVRARTLLVTAALAALPAGSAMAANVTNYWDAGQDGNWNVPANWSQDRVPAYVAGDDSDYAYVNSGNTVTVNSDVGTARGLYVSEATSGAPVTPGSKVIFDTGGTLVANNVIRISGGGEISVTGGDVSVLGTSFSFAVGNAGTDTATLSVSAGTVTANNFRLGHGINGNGVVNLSNGQINGTFYLGGESPATVNQTGGLWTGSSHYLGYGSTGIYNLSDGELRSTGRLRIGHTSDGTLTVTGGTLNATSYPVLLGSDAGDGAGLLAVSKGTVTMASGLYVGNSGGTGSGTLRITGSDASLSITNSGKESAGLDVYANGTLNFQIGAAGVSTITINAPSPNNSGQASKLAGTLDIDLLRGFTPALGQTFDLITNQSTYSGTTGGTFTNGYDITGLALAPADQPYWSFAVVHDSVNNLNILRLTNTAPVPEPASVALLVLAAPALLRHRRA